MSMSHKLLNGRRYAPPRLLGDGSDCIGKSTHAAAASKPPFIPPSDARMQIECGSFPRATRLADAAWRATQVAEQSWIAAASAIGPDEWRRKIDRIGDETVRVLAANIIWWSFFGARPAKDAWHDLDHFLAAWTPRLRADPKCVRAALVQVGFPVHLADLRVKNQESESNVCRGNRRVKTLNKTF